MKVRQEHRVRQLQRDEFIFGTENMAQKISSSIKDTLPLLRHESYNFHISPVLAGQFSILGSGSSVSLKENPW